jgi:hypothetical protein
MLNTCAQICVQVVGSLGEALGKVLEFYAQVISNAQRFAATLGFLHNLNTSFTHGFKSYTQKATHLMTPYFFPLLPISHRTYYYY